MAGIALLAQEEGGGIHTSCPRIYRHILPLVLNVFITLLTECTGLVHSTALRWALGPKLTFNSNLRLFTRVPGRTGFGRLTNLVNALCLILSYAGATVFFSNLPPQAVCDRIPYADKDCRDDDESPPLYIQPWALLVPGIGLMGQAMTASIQAHQIQIPTWSSSPFNNAWASSSSRIRHHGRCMLSVHDSDQPTVAVLPRARQRSAWVAHPEVRWIFVFVWDLVALIMVWWAVLFGVLRATDKACKSGSGHRFNCDGVVWGRSWSLIPDMSGISTLAQIDLFNNPIATSRENFQEIPRFAGDSRRFASNADNVLALCRVASDTVTRRRHLAPDINFYEGLSHQECHRHGHQQLDECAASRIEADHTLALRSYRRILLQLRYFHAICAAVLRATAMILVALFTTFLCFQKPKGPQPATFGHIQTLVDRIDVWGEPLYLGDKGPGSAFGHRDAGTTISEPGGKILMNHL